MARADVPSSFGLGCVNLGASTRGGVQLVHQALDLGVHYFDTADVYGAGSSEAVLGRALQGRRHLGFVATKAGYVFRERHAFEHAARRAVRAARRVALRMRQPESPPAAHVSGRQSYETQDFTPDYLRRAIEGSLRRLKTDYIDLYQLHGPRSVSGDDVLALMMDLRSQGKIREFGVGLEDVHQALPWLDTDSLTSVQIPFGILDPAARHVVIPELNAHGVRVVVRAIFAGGLLAHRSDADVALLRPEQPAIRSAVRALASSIGVSPLQVATWFVTAQPGVSTVLVGASSVPHLKQSLGFACMPAPDAVLDRLNALVRSDVADQTTEYPGEGGRCDET